MSCGGDAIEALAAAVAGEGGKGGAKLGMGKQLMVKPAPATFVVKRSRTGVLVVLVLQSPCCGKGQ